jgi:regulator of protease activity HflC (stomatin/prohibitin superfamily)
MSFSRNNSVSAQTLLLMGGSALMLLMGLLSLNAFKVIPTGERGVRTFLGKAQDVVPDGLNTKFALLGDIQPMNVRSQTVKLNLDAYSRDAQPTAKEENTLELTFSLPPEHVMRVFQQYGPNYVETQVIPRARNVYREEFGKLDALTIIADRGLLNQAVQRRLAQELDTLGLRLEAIALGISFTPAFDAASERVAVARSEVNEAEQQRLKAAKERETLILKAQGQAEQIRLQSQALRENPQYADLVRAQAFQTLANKWDGKSFPYFMGGDPQTLFQSPAPAPRQ